MLLYLKFKVLEFKRANKYFKSKSSFVSKITVVFVSPIYSFVSSKQKIKDYKPLLDEAIKNNNFDREIALKKELENLENICSTNEKTIDQMVYKLYDLTEDEIKIVEGTK